jgi:hypothetical protein
MHFVGMHPKNITREYRVSCPSRKKPISQPDTCLMLCAHKRVARLRFCPIVEVDDVIDAVQPVGPRVN